MIQQIPLVGISATAPIINPDIRVVEELVTKEPYASVAVNSNSGTKLKNSVKKKEKQPEVSIYFDEDYTETAEQIEILGTLSEKIVSTFSSLFLAQVIAQQPTATDTFFSKVRVINFAPSYGGITYETMGLKDTPSARKPKTHELKFANDNSNTGSGNANMVYQQAITSTAILEPNLEMAA